MISSIVFKKLYKIFFLLYPFSLERLILKEISRYYNNLVDIGCGDGGFLYRIKKLQPEFNKTLLGFDIFFPAIIEAKKKKIYHNLIQGDIRNLPFKSNSFDCVLVSHAIEHIEKTKLHRKL